MDSTHVLRGDLGREPPVATARAACYTVLLVKSKSQAKEASFEDAMARLEKLVEEIERAKEARAIDKEIAVEAEYHVQQSAKEAKSKRPNKGSILEHIGKAKALLDDVAAVAGLVTALLKAAEVASNILR